MSAAVGLDLLHAAVRLREAAEPLRRDLPAARDLVLDELDQRGRRLGVSFPDAVRSAIASAGLAYPSRARRSRAARRGSRPSARCRGRGPPGVERQRRPRPDLRGVDLVTAGEVRHRVALDRVRQVVAQHVEVVGAGATTSRQTARMRSRGRASSSATAASASSGAATIRSICATARSTTVRGDTALSRHPRARSPRIQERGDRAQARVVAVQVLGSPCAGSTRCRPAGRPVRRSGSPCRAGPSELDPRERLRRDRLEHVHRRAEGEVERVAVDRGEPLERRAVPGLRQRPARLADVGEPVVVASRRRSPWRTSGRVRAALPRSDRPARGPVRCRSRSVRLSVGF